MTNLTFIDKNKNQIQVQAENGKSILDIAKENDIDLMGACDGNCACGTCHVYIDEETLKKIDHATEDEENVLDIVFNLKQNSRLACQVIVNEKMEGAIITIPE